MKPILRILTFAIATLAAFASTGGLLLSDLYRDNDLYKTAWKANDGVTLLLIPFLIAAHNWAAGRRTAKVVWLGLIGFMFYNYAFYLFGAAFNPFFLVYVLLVTASLYALILGLIDIQSELDSTPSPPGRNWVAAFLLLTAIPLAIVEVRQYVDFILSGKPPEIPVLVLALDLSLIVPTALLAAALLIANDTWAYWLAGIMVVKSFAYGLVLITATMLITIKNVGPLDPLLPFYMFICLGGLLSLIILLQPKDRKVTIEPH